MASAAERKRIGFALFGTGRIGSVHFKNLVMYSGRVDVQWVVEEDTDKARALLEEYNYQDKVKVARTDQLDTVLADPKVDAVMVCTPSFTHEKIVKASVEAGKAVFCEKPLAPTIQAIKECYDAANLKDVPLFCAFNRRYDPQCRKIYNQIKSGGLGKPRVIKSTSRDPPSMMTKDYLMSSGGIFLDSAIHDIDMVCWLAGEEPVSVYATGHATDQLYVDCDDIDSCVVTLRFPGGAIGAIEMSRGAQFGYDQRLEVLGTKGMIQSENKRPTEVWQWTLEGATVDPIYTFGPNRYLDSYRLELEHFLDVLDGKTPLGVNGTDTLLANRIATACKKSLDTGNVIQL